MGTSLTGTKPKDTYDSLIKVGDNGPISGTAKYLSDGLGNDLPIAVSTSNVAIGTSSPQGKLDVTKAGKATIAVLDSTAFAAGVGGSIDLGGNYRSTGDFGAFTRIAAEKSNATDGNFGFDLGFYVTTNGGSTQGTKVATMTSTGVLDLTQGQIKFPATQVASADPNTLDDYEEGTFTATLKGSISDPTTPVTTTGYYTKIGNRVMLNVFFNNIDTTGGAGEATVIGFPFASGAGRFSGSVSTFQFNFSGTSLAAYTGASSTSVEFLSSSSGGSWSAATISAGTGRYLAFSITYNV